MIFLSRYEEELKGTLQATDSNKGKSCWSRFEHNASKHQVPMSNHWSGPEVGTVKLNSDASVIPEMGDSWAGAVARDH